MKISKQELDARMEEIRTWHAWVEAHARLEEMKAREKEGEEQFRDEFPGGDEKAEDDAVVKLLSTPDTVAERDAEFGDKFTRIIEEMLDELEADKETDGK